MTGRVKWYDSKKGYGFLTANDTGVDYFVHHSQVPADDKNVKTLETDATVTFDIVEGKKGDMAGNITVIAEAPAKASKSPGAPKSQTVSPQVETPEVIPASKCATCDDTVVVTASPIEVNETETIRSTDTVILSDRNMGNEVDVGVCVHEDSESV